MFDLIVVGALFSVYCVGTFCYSNVQYCRLSKKINKLRDRLAVLGVLYEQGDMSITEYYEWLRKVNYYHTKFATLSKKSIVFQRLAEHFDECDAIIADLATMSNKETHEFWLRVLHAVVKYQITGEWDTPRQLAENSDAGCNAEFQKVPLHESAVEVIKKTLNKNVNLKDSVEHLCNEIDRICDEYDSEDDVNL